VRKEKSKPVKKRKAKSKPKKSSIQQGPTRSITAEEDNVMGDANLVRMDGQDQDKSIQIQGF